MSKKIILLAGSTASGKSRLAIQLAKKVNGEIINADSMQVYKEFSILSSRPNNKEIKKAKHHLYGIISVKKYFSAGDWLKLAKSKINQCHKAKKIPIIVGGTGLYFNTITKGISKIPNIDIKTRNKVRSLFKKLGYKNFYEKLLNIDPKVKNKILNSLYICMLSALMISPFNLLANCIASLDFPDAVGPAKRIIFLDKLF